MEEVEDQYLSENENQPVQPPEVPWRPPEPRVRMVLIAQFALFLMGVAAFQVISMLAGWSELPPLTADSSDAARWITRLQLGIGHFLTFSVSSFLTVWIFYRRISNDGPDWQDYLGTRRLPGASLTGMTILMMAVSLPLVLFLLNVNQQIPLPEVFRMAEDQTEEMLKSLLKMENAGALLVNLTIIALLPALGEELMFRGVIQQQLMRRIADPRLALLLSAAIFSFAHFQFEGFLPRMLLGLLLGWLYWRTHNFWVVVLAHFFNNGLQIVGQYMYGKELSSVDLEQDIQVPWFAAAVSALLIWVAMRQIDQTNKLIIK